MATSPIDFASMMPQVAVHLLGEPKQIAGGEMRYGTHGSLSVNLEDGTFYSHEEKAGGGVIDLIIRQVGGDRVGALKWLEENGYKEPFEQQDNVRQIGDRRKSVSIFYDYCDEDGAVLFRVEKRGKGLFPPFLQHGPDGKGGFHAVPKCMQGVQRVPYRLPELVRADPGEIVFLCEGEKDADRLASLGLIATTNPGGAGKFTTGYAAKLRGRRVILLEDNDDAGRNHVEVAANSLKDVAAVTAILKLDGLPPKGDVSDWLDAGHTVDELKALAEVALKAGDATETFPLADLSVWDATRATPKSFIMPGLVPTGELTLCTGAGGANKSTFGQQLATCCAAGRPMLGIDVVQCPTLYLTCEDDEGRLHWMQEGICRAVGARIGNLAGQLHLGSLRGRLGNELATFDGEGRLRPSPSFYQLRATIVRSTARLVVLDNAAHLFAGNENDRQQVTAFVNLLYSLCLELGVTVILVAHSNKAGDSYSGSTAWLNAVRSQIVITRPDDGLDPDERVLTVGKANYARQGEELRFRWHDFALIRDEDLPEEKRGELAESIKVAGANAAFLNCLRARAAQGEGRGVGPASGPNYAPSQFEGMPEAKGFGKQALKAAMDRLFSLGNIETYSYQNKEKARSVTLIREVPDLPRMPSRTLPEHASRTAPNAAPNTPAHTPPPYGGNGAAPQAAAPSSSDRSKAAEGQGDRGVSAKGMILAPGESDADPVPGWEEDRRPRF
ncbi:AAA family ATPase [Sphingobium phenoxybenzoativorans]|uniref:AAA family ATPase n=1 Tax=Sphingobium phenoxybenzoativorans TaxID=1592790 RepID=A0A975Q0T0_9SPHN|nr:AAA family ATPase [Sphingobium phenoxybenzoativorans]QUT05200.1 AAA family ATPase [Sphingobium phenoxybenzoativorans]